MSDDKRRFDRALTDDEMDAVMRGIERAAGPSEAVENAVFSVFRALNPDFDADYAREAPIKSTDYRIPSAQWVGIAERLQEACSIQLDRAQISLVWMNYGPSSKEES